MLSANTDLPAAAVLVVYALAVARVTGLIVQDSITEGLRDGLLVWLDDRRGRWAPLLADLIGCPWCVSMWVAGVAAPLIWIYGQQPVMLVPALALAFSQVTGMIHNLGR